MADKTREEIGTQLLDSIPAGRRPYIEAAQLLTKKPVEFAHGYKVLGNEKGPRRALHVLAKAIEEGILTPPLPEPLADVITEVSTTIKQAADREKPSTELNREKFESRYLQHNYEGLAELVVQSALDFARATEYWTTPHQIIGTDH
jgi:hypothetical protein